MDSCRATITISGEVQDVGFRAKVMRIAQKAGLVGHVENLPDGSVRVICEGEEKAIKAAVKTLDIHEDYIDVKEVQVEWSKAQGKFKYFQVKYSNTGAEMSQGFATAGRMLNGVRSDIRGMSNKQDTMNETLGNIDNRLGNVIERYDIFGEKMTKLEHDIGGLTYQIKRLVDHVVGEEIKK